jgi:hypothetical protein
MIPKKTEEEYDARITSLAYSCPMYNQDSQCPLKEIRKKSFNQRIKWLSSLSLETKKNIYQNHLLCFFKKKADCNELFSISKKEQVKNNSPLIISDKAKSLTSKCKKNFSCLNEQKRNICPAKKCILESVLYITFTGKERCNYNYSIGGNSFCGCPARKELYNTYQI